MTGTTECAIGERDGNVVISFPHAVSYASFDPETARQVGEAIAKESYKARYGIEHNGKSVIGEDVRNRLITRATHIIKNLDGRGNKPGVIAIQVVDTILAEIT